ncbi:MAG: hypothetical protein PHP86_19775, partial [Nevskiales bacterium]|nr:hypothetical protein [Nevskiales bacterium]
MIRRPFAGRLAFALFAGLLALPAGAAERVSIDWDAGKAQASSVQFAVPQAVSYSARTHGTWTQDGDAAVWTLDVEIPGAVTSSFAARDVVLPEGATLSIAGAEGKAITMDAKWIVDGRLWSELVDGDRFTLVARMPRSTADDFALTVFEVQGGFRNPMAKAAGDVVNYACKANASNRLNARSTGALLINNSTSCTGTLMNNAAGDYRKFFLTASHCAGATDLASNDYAGKAPGFKVYFNEETPCGQTLGSARTTTPTVGAVHRVRVNDHWLVELTGTLPAGVYFSGFDASGTTPTALYAIHHASAKDRQWLESSSPLRGTIGFGGEMMTFWSDAYDDGVSGPGGSGGAVVSSQRLVGVISTGGGTNYQANALDSVYNAGLNTYLGNVTTLAGAEPPAPPTVTLGANPTTVAWNGSTALSWTTTNATSCTASDAWSGAKATSGSENDVPGNASTTSSRTATYTLTCTGPGGEAFDSVSVTVTAKPAPPTV